MDEVIKATASWSCVVCRKKGRSGANVVSMGGFYRHAKCTPVSDPAPTVDAMDDVSTVPLCRQGGQAAHSYRYADDDHGNSGSFCVHCEEPEEMHDPIPAEHRPGRPPAPAEVDYWQQQAREAAGRHMAQADTDTPYVALLKEELAEDVANAYGSMGGADLMDPAPVERMFIGSPEVKIVLPTPDEFLDPAEPEVELNVSGQPPARRNSKGQYLVVDPATGDFRRYKNGNPIGYTRATTFVKSLVDGKALNDWGKANVAMGASLRPDILRRAHRLTWEENKSELLRIVDELQTAAGAKVSADEGTFLHGFTELMDAGLKDWQQAPEAYQADLARYTEALKKHGLEPVPGLIERTVMIREFGGIVGTFDRIFYHRPSGSYVVGDLKTGKTLSYGIDEIHAQIWLYAHGVNQNGVYDWNTDTWGAAFDGCECEMHLSNEDCLGPRDIRVREDVGVIIHMPVQGPEAGEVYVRKADLVKGRENAEECHRHRSRVKSKVEDFAIPEPTWEERFAGVTSGEHANQLWRLAKAEGITGIRLNDLITIARTAITSRVDTSS